MNLAILEQVLCAYLRPTFLVIQKPEELNDPVEIIISCSNFSAMDVTERVKHVFDLIKLKCPQVLQEYLLIIQTYDNEQMELLLDDIFTEELR